jgi:hypothetical protein
VRLGELHHLGQLYLLMIKRSPTRSLSQLVEGVSQLAVNEVDSAVNGPEPGPEPELEIDGD